MPILGRKPVPEEEEPITTENSNGRFTMRWIKDLTQKSFGLSTKDDRNRRTSKGKTEKYGVQTEILQNDQEEIQRGKFSYKQLKAATQDFSPANKIGDGGFGLVYKGVLRDEGAIAVKILSPVSRQGIQEFVCELKALTTLSHPNIVTLFGHCITVDKKYLLVYEYCANGSLDKALCDSSKLKLKERLNWETRVKICIGIAKGLVFLHEGAEFNFVHRDIKLANVLLDEHLNPKISDFGLAVPLSDEEYTGLVAGTWGYMAPEYLMQGYVTEKTDVYSFGVLVLELVSGRRCFGTPLQHLIEIAKVLKQNRNLISLLDQDLTNVPADEATMVLNLAILCTSDSPKERPKMSDVVRILQGKGVLNTPDIPLEPDDLARVVSEKMTLSDFSDNYLDIISLEETVTGQGNASTTSQNELLILSKSRNLTSQISTNAPTPETPISDANASSTSSTFEDINGVGDEDELVYIEPHFEEGKYHIRCSDEEFKVECNKWKNSLVGYLLSEDGTFDVDKEVDETVLRETIPPGNGHSLFSMGNGYYLFQFSCVEDKIRVLESSGLLRIVGKPLILTKWDWKLKFDKAATMKSVPLWVKIYNLPLFLWNSSCLSKVVSAFGIPICADQKTMKQQRLDYARVYMEVDAGKPLLDSFLITVKGIDYLLSLEYDWKPLRCTNCFTFGHIDSKCKLRIKMKQD